MIPENYCRAIVERIDSFYSASQSFKQALLPLLKSYHYPNAEYLLRRGRKPAFAWYLLKGYAREIVYTDNTGTGHTTWFWFPDDLIIPHPVFFTQRSAVTDIEVLSGSVLLEFSYEDLMQFKTKFPEVTGLIDELRFHYDHARLKHAEDLFNLKGKEKYEKFYRARPGLFNVAKHKDIASFLWIKDIGFRRYFSVT